LNMPEVDGHLEPLLHRIRGKTQERILATLSPAKDDAPPLLFALTMSLILVADMRGDEAFLSYPQRSQFHHTFLELVYNKHHPP